MRLTNKTMDFILARTLMIRFVVCFNQSRSFTLISLEWKISCNLLVPEEKASRRRFRMLF